MRKIFPGLLLVLVAVHFACNTRINVTPDNTAQAQQVPVAEAAPIVVECDRVATSESGDPTSAAYMARTAYFADVAIPGFEPRQAPHVSVVLCDSTSPWAVVDPGATGYAPPTTACAPAQDVVMDTGHLVVFCGATEQNGASGAPHGRVYQHAYVRVN